RIRAQAREGIVRVADLARFGRLERADDRHVTPGCVDGGVEEPGCAGDEAAGGLVDAARARARVERHAHHLEAGVAPAGRGADQPAAPGHALPYALSLLRIGHGDGRERPLEPRGGMHAGRQRQHDGQPPPRPHGYSSGPGCRRMAFFSAWARLPASTRSCARRERRRFWRRMRGISCSRALAAPRTRASTTSASRRRARKRFIACVRASWHLTATPVGTCRSTTQVATLLTFCPPLPPERTKRSTRS